jgi:cellulose synthase/poly-beta-1,6-N-acetylglucosamine synthase-like glycosyltransferase
MGAMTVDAVILWAFLSVALYFQVLLLFITIHTWRKEGRRAEGIPKLSHYPSVEVVVPCFNEEKTVVGTVRSLLALSYPKDKLRITVVNDGSTDGTSRVLKRFWENPRIRIIEKTNGGKHTAMNRAIEESRADIIGCLDADSYVRGDALLQIVSEFNKDPFTMAVTPCMKVAPPKTLVSHMQKAEYELGIFLRKVFTAVNSQFVLPGPFSFYRREVFEKLGMFRPAHNTEDLEMGLRMQRAHMKIGNSSRAMVYTNTPPVLPALFKQRVRWSYGFLRNSIDYRELFFNKKHPFLGFIVLPFVFLSTFMAIYIFFSMLYHMGLSIIEKMTEVSVVGWSALIPTFTFSIDWFTFAPTAFSYIATVATITAIGLILLGRHIGEEPVRFDRAVFLYLFCYGFVAPFWLTKAVFDAMFARGNRWR